MILRGMSESQETKVFSRAAEHLRCVLDRLLAHAAPTGLDHNCYNIARRQHQCPKSGPQLGIAGAPIDVGRTPSAVIPTASQTYKVGVFLRSALPVRLF